MTYEQARAQMVDQQLRQRGIWNRRILAAFETVPRHLFVDEQYERLAYADSPLPIPAGQTISQPYVVAYMIQAMDVQPQDRLLEIGAGSGYAAAILALIASEVYTVERHAALVAFASHNLARAGYDNVYVRHGDGTLGWPEHAPYDGIIVAASGPDVPPALRDQLAVGGRLVMPTGDEHGRQSLVRLTRHTADDYELDDLGAVRFVPLVGRQGW